MGTVHAAENTRTGAKAVVKIIHDHLVRRNNIREAFFQGVTRAIALDHPGVVPALMTGEDDSGSLYVVSAWAEGTPLTDLLLQQGAVPEQRALEILGGLAGVLAAAHAMKLVHGDLTPENIWLSSGQGRPGGIAVTDFGMSPLHRAPGFEEQRPPYYLSPEQIRGEAPGVSSDIYALGVIAYQLLTGRLPFSSPRPRDVLLMHLNDDPPPPASLTTVSPEIELFLFRALAKDPTLRPPDMRAVQAALSGEPVPDPPEEQVNTPPTMDDMVMVKSSREPSPANVQAVTIKAAPRALKERDHAETSGQFESGVYQVVEVDIPEVKEPDLVIVEEEAPEEDELEFNFADGTGHIERIPPGNGPDPVITGILPGLARPDAPVPTPAPMMQLLPTLFGLICGVGVGLAAFRLFTGAWPYPLG